MRYFLIFNSNNKSLKKYKKTAEANKAEGTNNPFNPEKYV